MWLCTWRTRDVRCARCAYGEAGGGGSVRSSGEGGRLRSRADADMPEPGCCWLQHFLAPCASSKSCKISWSCTGRSRRRVRGVHGSTWRFVTLLARTAEAGGKWASSKCEVESKSRISALPGGNLSRPDRSWGRILPLHPGTFRRSLTLSGGIFSWIIQWNV